MTKNWQNLKKILTKAKAKNNNPLTRQQFYSETWEELSVTKGRHHLTSTILM